MNNNNIIEWLNNHKDVRSYTRNLVREKPELIDDIIQDTFCKLIEKNIDLVTIYNRNPKEVLYMYFAFAWRTYKSNATHKTYDFHKTKITFFEDAYSDEKEYNVEQEFNFVSSTLPDNISANYVNTSNDSVERKFIYSIDSHLVVDKKDSRKDAYGKKLLTLYLQGYTLRGIAQKTNISHTMIGKDIKYYLKKFQNEYEEKNIIE